MHYYSVLPCPLIKRTEKNRIQYLLFANKRPLYAKEDGEKNGFVALRRIYVDGETKDHGYVYHGACTTDCTYHRYSILRALSSFMEMHTIIELCSHKKFAIFICMYLQ